ncbi:MAG TPA: sterol desaturase family protein [Flavisolibacter sp.]|jgi:sterol desaturase/sphingolipid hydroxylase (fatty acid hydroxylase superfamily)|nr:sterol desaturase family protein [Flavisolibacter sp.]
MNLIHRFFDKKATPLLAFAVVVFIIAESRFRLRKRTQPRWQRVVTNAVVSIPAFSLLRFLLIPAMVKIAFHNRHSRTGIIHHLPTIPSVKTITAFLLLDYTNYLWHILLHKIPLLWRFHLVHHSDLDLDLTTAFRFHFGELIGSVLYRGGTVFFIGASPMQVLVYEALFEGATQFHHSNWKLPYTVEKRLNKVIVTPRMHGIHHSMIRQETDSNYSVVFSFWDRLHKTLRLNVPQNQVVIGVPSYSDPAELTIGQLWKLPFTKIRPWKAISDATDVRGTGGDQTIMAE